MIFRIGCPALATVTASLLCHTQASAADRYWSGGSGSSDNIDQGANWYGGNNPSSGDNLYFNNTVNRHWAYSNYGSGSYFGEIVSYSGAGGIKWRGDQTYLYRFQNFNDSNLLESEATLSNRTGPNADLEINPYGSGGVKVHNVVMQNGMQLKVYGTNTLTVAGSISQSGSGDASVAILGSATVVLEGTNNYLGTTSVNAGTLKVNGNQSAATGNVTVASGATLGGNGTIGGATTVNGTHSVGTGTGNAAQQYFTNSLTYGAASIFSWDLTGDSNSTGFDRVDGDGGDALTVNSTAIFRIVLGTGVNLASGFWDTSLIQWSNIFTDFTGSASFNNALLQVVDHNGAAYDTSAQGYFSISGTTVSWSAIPEPSSIVAGLLVAAGLLRRPGRTASPLSGAV